VDVLDYRVLASFLESAGDAIAEVAKGFQAETVSKAVAKEYSVCIAKLVKMEDLAIKSFLTRKTLRPRSIYLEVNAIARELSEDLARIAQQADAKQGSAVKILGGVARVSSLLTDIADLAVPTQSVT
jgi:hypothetical protein